MRTLTCAPTIRLLNTLPAWSEANGTLRIHDGALLLSPLGETVLFDTGDCHAAMRTQVVRPVAKPADVPFPGEV